MSCSKVVSDWKAFSIRIVQDSDIPSILDYLSQNFYLDEPIWAQLPLDQEFIATTNHQIKTILEPNPGLSVLVAFDKILT